MFQAGAGSRSGAASHRVEARRRDTVHRASTHGDEVWEGAGERLLEAARTPRQARLAGRESDRQWQGLAPSVFHKCGCDACRLLVVATASAALRGVEMWRASEGLRIKCRPFVSASRHRGIGSRGSRRAPKAGLGTRRARSRMHGSSSGSEPQPPIVRSTSFLWPTRSGPVGPASCREGSACVCPQKGIA